MSKTSLLIAAGAGAVLALAAAAPAHADEPIAGLPLSTETSLSDVLGDAVALRLGETPANLLAPARAADVVEGASAGAVTGAGPRVDGAALFDGIERFTLVLEDEWASVPVEGDLVLPAEETSPVVAGGAVAEAAPVVDVAARVVPTGAVDGDPGDAPSADRR
ncbi:MULTISPECIES: hypothetical protein [unclassified Rathayibacter]|uniref:hypothetical protein n=1 Tax=unclassified Rathayibacter TaxID=2609250 RepID=UPI001FB3ED6A|nr:MULTISPECIES: hypothetical protein [unclassified Rathayibacter]MCJ1672346.1 hypothetical protein [Rathayibacter sp. VKM Ac-2929]MCJ1685070.1 hypothetical protein [Rathayibacter sp. VKM Ac-2928]